MPSGANPTSRSSPRSAGPLRRASRPRRRRGGERPPRRRMGGRRRRPSEVAREARRFERTRACLPPCPTRRRALKAPLLRRAVRGLLRFLDRVAPHRGHGDLYERVLLGRVTGRAGGPQRLDALLEEPGVLLLDGLSDLDKGALEEELLGALAVDRPPLKAERERLAELLMHVGGVLPVAVHPAPVHLRVAVRDLCHGRLEAAELTLYRLGAGGRGELDQPVRLLHPLH